MLLEKTLQGKRMLTVLTIAVSIAVVALAVLILLIRMDLVGLRPAFLPSEESSPYMPPGFVFNVYGGQKGSSEELARPMGVGLGKGRVFVTDGAHGTVKVFDRKGSLINSFSIAEELRRDRRKAVQIYPVGIVVDERERLYISDLESSSIMVFDRNGRKKGLFPGSEESRSLLKKPLALAVAGGLLYVTDIGDHSVKVFDRAGKLVRRFGRRGVREGEFSFPNGIAVSKDGSIFVADSNNSRVQVFSPAGKFKFLIEGKPALVLPRGLAIDGFDRLHVADTLGHRVSVFTLKGKFLFSYGWEEEENSEQQLYYPNGIAVDTEDRRIYITDKGNNRVSVWEY